MINQDQRRQTHSRSHLVHLPEAFVRTHLANLRNAKAVVHVAPGPGGHFLQYTVQFQEEGVLELDTAQQFLYVSEGEVELGECSLRQGDYAYTQGGIRTKVSAKGMAQAIVIETPSQQTYVDV